MFSLYLERCELKLMKCKQFDELWNIVQEKGILREFMLPAPKEKEKIFFLRHILGNRLGILDRIEKYLGMEFNEVRKLSIPYLKEHGFIQEKEINGEKDFVLITTPEEDRKFYEAYMKDFDTDKELQEIYNYDREAYKKEILANLNYPPKEEIK